jgi:hypothetical protein
MISAELAFFWWGVARAEEERQGNPPSPDLRASGGRKNERIKMEKILLLT